MIEVALPVAIASFLGSLHCAGMCGPLATFACGAEAPRRRLVGVAYHGARGAAYAGLGAVAGLAGAGVDDLGVRVGLGRLGAVLAGVTMILWAGALLFGVTAPGLSRGSGRLARMLGRLRERPPLVRSALLGAGSALLPCGWLHAFVLVAAGTGSALAGAVAMIAFWAGTLPALFGVSLGARGLARRLGPRATRLGAAALVLVGLLIVIRRTELGPVSAPVTEIGALPSEAPCHGH